MLTLLALLPPLAAQDSEEPVQGEPPPIVSEVPS